jgi:hypothetical protein
VSIVTAVTGVTRWPLICRLIVDADGESLRLALLLESWPATRRRHLAADDVKRRIWRCRPKGRVR